MSLNEVASIFEIMGISLKTINAKENIFSCCYF